MALRASAVSRAGLRTHMEDRYVLDTDFGGRGWVFAGVYDGHGGAGAADYAAGVLHTMFLTRILAGALPADAFTQSYHEVSDHLASQDSGATAVNAFIREGVLYTANVGDARAIVIGAESVLQLTVDHRLDNAIERHRVAAAGGRIEYPYTFRGDAGLMPTRTLGDPYFKPVGIISQPSVNEYRLRDDVALLLASDGLFDFMSNEDVAAYVRRFPAPELLLDELEKEVFSNRGGSDNLTIIVVRLTD